MIKKNIHVVPYQDRWAVKKEGTQKPLSVHNTQATALQTGRRKAIQNSSELFIHGNNGRFRDGDSCGKDPCPPKDKKH